jgi:hypothetical protein
MKRKGLIFLATIVVSTIIIGIYVTAKQPTSWDYYAYGGILDYQDAPSAEIKSGFWSLKISGKKIWLTQYYLEENLDDGVENSPESSVDIFEKSIVGDPIFFFEDEAEKKLYLFAEWKVKKTWATFDGTYQPVTWHSYRMLIIDFDDGIVLFDGYPPDPFSDPPLGSEEEPPVNPAEPWTYDWDIEGTLLGYNWSPY